MYKDLSSRHDQGEGWHFQLGRLFWQLSLPSMDILIRPSVDTLSGIMEQASWWSVLVQFLNLVVVTSTISFLGLLMPSAALHGIIALTVGPLGPLGWLPFPLNGITLVFASFFIGLGTAYGCSKVCGGRGTFLAHFYCLLVCTIPLVIVSGGLLLIPATGWLLSVFGCILCALLIYRMILHIITIMAVHRLSADKATLIVLILPIALLVLIVIVGLCVSTHGEGIGDFGEVCLDWGFRKRSKKRRMIP